MMEIGIFSVTRNACQCDLQLARGTATVPTAFMPPQHHTCHQLQQASPPWHCVPDVTDHWQWLTANVVPFAFYHPSPTISLAFSFCLHMHLAVPLETRVAVMASAKHCGVTVSMQAAGLVEPQSVTLQDVQPDMVSLISAPQHQVDARS